MKHFEEWAKDKSPLIEMASFLVVTSCEPFRELLEKIKDGERIEGYIELPPVKEWLNLYRNHRKIYDGVASIFVQLNDETATMANFYEEVQAGFHMMKQITTSELNDILNELTQEDRKELFNTAKHRLKEVNDFILNNIVDDDEEVDAPSDDEKRRIRKLRNKPEMIFFMRVWAPCFLLYGEYPTYLFRKARQGNLDGLEKLLRLDKSVIYDTKIMEIYQKATVSKNRETMTLITKALQNTPKGKIDIQKIKYLFGGFLSVISIALGQKLTAAEIHRLFDAVARDMTDEIVDPDLIASPETFEKAIQRARTFWQVISLPDKK